MTYRGRFAPSPSGPLHFGSIVTAVASYLDARAHHGEWCLRIDDLDQPRVLPGAESAILRELERLGLWWNGPVNRQTHSHQRYAQGVERLREFHRCYDCGCTRREIGRGPYPGTCRNGINPDKLPRSIRFLNNSEKIWINDRIRGWWGVECAAFGGDFIVQRADRLSAYHLACVLDDNALGITDIVRGGDLLSPSAAQYLLTSALRIACPRYAHVAIVTNTKGIKLSKRAQALSTAIFPAEEVIIDAFATLGLPIDDEISPAIGVTELIAWGIAHWGISKVSQEPVLAPERYTK